MKKALAIITLLVSLPLLGACNTTAGAGEDLSQAGTAIQKSAVKNTPY